MSQVQKFFYGDRTADAAAASCLRQIASKEAFLQQTQDLLDLRPDEDWCIAAVDIDQFKLYNELYSRQQGDALLERLAASLSSYQQRTGFPVSYWGNDDFFLCMPDNTAELEGLLGTLQAHLNTGEQEITFHLSCGVCPVQEHPENDLQTLCSYAQIALTHPSPVHSSVHRFTLEMLTQLKEQQTLLSELQRALANHEFCFFLQPKCNSVTRTIVGMEALVRWNHPTRGCLSPGEFMPALERTGLVTELDQYIWESVCKTLKKWQDSGSNLVPVSINISVVDILHLDVPQILSDLVEKYELEPKLLTAEITESMVVENTAVVENTIQGLHRKGFTVMMDDFGSGSSSLSMLKDTNVDAIKLDMKFIDLNEQNRSKGLRIMESVVNMAHRLNLPIIAEGVETPEQVSMLQDADCLYTQGYYFYRPMPVENAEQLLAKPDNADYWDINRDLICRDRRLNPADPAKEQLTTAMHTYQILADNILMLGLLNLSTGTQQIIKHDARLAALPVERESDFAYHCEYLAASDRIHADDVEQFLAQTDLPFLRSSLFHSTEPVFLRLRQKLAGQFVWVTLEILPCRGCCAQDPWAAVCLKEDPQSDQLVEELDFSYSHDPLTGLLNRRQYEADLAQMPHSGLECVVCTYLDVIDLHEVNVHLGRHAGDKLLCTVANALRKFFVGSQIYRAGGDEFVILTPDALPYDVLTSVDQVRSLLKEQNIILSAGIQYTADLTQLDAALRKAELAMQQDKQTHYARTGSVRQLRSLNKKLEETLVQKQDAEHFLHVLAPKYKTVYAVDFQSDSARPIIVADYVSSIVQGCGNSFRAMLTAYRDTLVSPEHQAAFNVLLDYEYVRSKVLRGDIIEHRYTKTDGSNFCIKVMPYSTSGTHIHETLWIFADENADLTPPKNTPIL